MSNTANKQLIQVNNIFKTLIEATEHFHKLVKEQELNQSIFIFSSIVDGFDSASKIYSASASEDWITKKNKVESYIFEIARMLENGNFIKISEILQFTFLPSLKKLNQLIESELGVNNQDEICRIGIFSGHANPRRFYPEPRINALVRESERQNAKLLFFTSTDIDFEKKEITAEVYTDGKWERIRTNFPDVVNNVGAGKRTYADRKLRRMVPFTSFHVGNKVSLPQRIVQYRKYAELLVPFRLCSNEAIINDFLEKNNKVVFKYLLSNRGENIYFVTKKGNRYVLSEHKKERILSQEAFKNWLETVVLHEKNSFIVQKYLHTRTKDNEPYHIRAHVQKNGEGKWVLTHIYPRLGSKKSNLSNVATDGRVEDFHSFLVNEYGEETGKKYESDILRLSIEVAQHLDKLYDLALDELGIDFAIDENGRYWMHEANNGPQTAYHEEKRAVNTIAYAKYIAKNGIYHSDSFRKTKLGLFQSRNSNLERANLRDQVVVGILTGNIEYNKLLAAFIDAAKEANIHLYAFKPKDIDYDQMVIRGHFYENDEWRAKIVRYPDVIIDHVKLRGDEDSQWFYEELEEIPFTNIWSSRLHRRSEIYDNIGKALMEDNDILIPYDRVSRTRDIFKYLEKYGKVTLKPEIGFKGTQYIEKLSNSKYCVTKANVAKEYNELQLLNMLKELIVEKKFIVQQDARLVDGDGKAHAINTHLLLGKDETWKLVDVFADNIELTNTNKDENYTILSKLLQDIHSDMDAKVLINMIETSSKSIAQIVKTSFNSVSELNIKFGLHEQQLRIMEINPNGPDVIYDKQNYAENIIQQAKRLIISNE